MQIIANRNFAAFMIFGYSKINSIISPIGINLNVIQGDVLKSCHNGVNSRKTRPPKYQLIENLLCVSRKIVALEVF